MKYYNVVRDILKYYKSVIDSKELDILKKIEYIIRNKKDEEISDDIVFFINRLLDRIWNLTLTDIKDFQSGDEFCFLVKKVVPFFEPDSPYSYRSKVLDSYFYKEKDNKGNMVDVKYNIVDTNNSDFELVTSDNLMYMNIDDYGIIISINYSNYLRTTPILPIYFKNHSLSVSNLTYDTIGYFAIDTKLGEYDFTVNSSKKQALKDNKKLVLVDKLMYNNTGKYNDNDIDQILGIFMLNYYNENNLKDVISLYEYKRILFGNDSAKIKKYIESFYKEKISFDELKSIIYKIIESKIKNLTNVKQK